MEIINVDLDKIKPYENNPRFNEDSVQYVANSIKEFGFKVPIVIDKNYVIVTGHTRYKASKKLKLKEVPCIIADDLTEEQINLFRIVDNKANEMSSWDYGLLFNEIEELKEFDLQEFGFLIEDNAIDFIEEMMDSDLSGDSADFDLEKIEIEFDKDYEEQIKKVIFDVGKFKIVEDVIQKIKEESNA